MCAGVLFAPRSFLYSLPILCGKKREVGVFLLVSLLACTLAVASFCANHSCWTISPSGPNLALIKRRHPHYLPFSSSNREAYGWSIVTSISIVDSPNLTAPLQTGLSLNSLWKSQLIMLWVSNHYFLTDTPWNRYRSFLLCMRSNISGTCQLLNKIFEISSYHMKVPWKAQESGKEGKDKDTMWPAVASVLSFQQYPS